ncbi:MAG: adenylate kinase [Bacilli bacterium]|nr:adenylate kinase [Bacilli bacterium]
MNLILIAPPAAGKGTQSKILEKVYGLAHISTGDLLREASSLDDDLSIKLREILASGQLVNDEIVLELLKRRILQEDCNNGYILDGFPRNVEQAMKYEEILAEVNRKNDFIIVLDVEKEILLQRITGRRICKNCGSIYNVNIESSKPKSDMICDNCGGTLYQREDDNEQSFIKRYDEYLVKTKPLVDYYSKEGNLYHIDANQSRDDITSQIKLILETR